MLDVEWILAVAPAVHTLFWSINVSDPITFNNSFILEWALQVLSVDSGWRCYG